MKKFFIFISFILITLLVLYFVRSEEAPKVWYKSSSKDLSLFGEILKVKDMPPFKDSDEKHMLFYDNDKKGMYCYQIKAENKIFVCNTAELLRDAFLEGDAIVDIIKIEEGENNGKTFIFEMNIKDLIALKMLEISTMQCVDDICIIKELDRYISFNYDFMNSIYSKYILH